MNEPREPVSAPALPRVIEGRHYTSSHHGLELADVIYRDCHFDRVTWADCRLSNLHFVNCRFDANRFVRSALTKLVHENCQIVETEWSDCVLRGMSLDGSGIRDAVWSKGVLQDVIFVKTSGASLRFDAVRAAHVSFIAGELTNVELNGGHWTDASWMSLQLNGLQVRASRIDNFIVGQSSCAACELDACTGINVRWIDCRIDRMNVRGSALNQAAWSHSTWSGGGIEASRLPLVSFDCAKLSRMTVRDAAMPQAIFDSAQVQDCELQGMHAPRVSLRDAQLARVQLDAAQLAGLDARGATLEEVGLNGADCRAGVLVGQSRQVWRAADTQQAMFDDAVLEEDRQWRQRAQPGARGV
jgi:uncharacterized protein YjbI with pentapeptide repeats